MDSPSFTSKILHGMQVKAIDLYDPDTVLPPGAPSLRIGQIILSFPIAGHTALVSAYMIINKRAKMCETKIGDGEFRLK